MIESFQGTGIRIAVSEPDTSGNFTGNDTAAAPNDWRQLVSGVDPTTSHSIELRLDYVDGPNNDVIGVYLDGKEIGTTTTFENFHDAAGGTHVANALVNLTDRVFFRPSGNGSPQTPGADQGFLIDNLTTAVYNNANGTGNDLANVITANDGNDILTGLGGNDILHGGAGIDTAAYGWSAGQLRRDLERRDGDRRRQPRRFAGRHRHRRPHQRPAVQRPQDLPGRRQ